MELQLPLRPTANDLVKLESLNDSVEAIPENGSVETPPLLRLPPAVRRRIYILAGIPQNRPLLLDKPWTIEFIPKHRPSCCTLPDDAYDMRGDMSHGIACAHSLLLTCRAISAEVAPLLYSGNHFITQDPKPLVALGPVLLGHLRSLRIVVHCVQGLRKMHTCMSHYPRRKVAPGPLTDEGRALLAEWDDTARSIGPHVSPGLLNFTLICEIAKAQRTEVGIAAARAALASLAHFPPLAACHIRLGLKSNRALFEMARGAAEAATRRQKPFRFADLPTEIRLRVLEFTDLVTPRASMHWEPVRGYFRTYEAGWRASPRRCGVSDIGCLCSGVHAAYSPGCRCRMDPVSLFLVDRTTLADAREVFFRSHHFHVGDRLSGCHSKAQFPGTPYFAKIIPRSALGALRSLTMRIDDFPWDGSKAQVFIEWQHMLRRLREDGGLNLRFLRLNIFYPALPSLPDLRGMTAEERFGLVRGIVHGNVWPLDAGDGACLPLGTRHLELELRSKTLCLGYRFRGERQALPFPSEAMQKHSSEWFDSRRLPGGLLQGLGESVEAVDWIEELGTLRHGWLLDWPRWGG